MPSNGTVHEKAFELQLSLVKAKGIPALMGMLTRNDFLSTADLRTKQLSYLTVLKICKLLFAVAGHSLVHMVAEACQPDSTSTVSGTYVYLFSVFTEFVYIFCLILLSTLFTFTEYFVNFY